MSQFARLVRRLTQFSKHTNTYLSFIEQDIWHDVWQTPCNNEHHILVCIGQLTNLKKHTKTKTKNDHLNILQRRILYSLPCMKL